MRKTTPTTATHASTIDTSELVSDAWGDVGTSPGRFCVMAGIDAMQRMMNEDAANLAGERCGRDAGKPGHRRGGHPARSASREAGSASNGHGFETRQPGARSRCRAGRRSVMAASSSNGQHR